MERRARSETDKRRIRARLMRALVATALAIAGMVVASLGQVHDVRERGEVGDPATARELLFAWGGAALTLIAGVVAIRSVVRAMRLVMSEQVGDARTAPAALLVSVAGYLILSLVVLSEVGVDMGGLLLGGALTGVIVGIAAQQTLGNFFAGLVLLLVRPFAIGDHIILRSGPLGGEFEGRVMEMTLFHVHLMTDHGSVALPNSGVLASAVGPGARAQKDEPQTPPDDPGPMHGGTS